MPHRSSDESSARTSSDSDDEPVFGFASGRGAARVAQAGPATSARRGAAKRSMSGRGTFQGKGIEGSLHQHRTTELSAAEAIVMREEEERLAAQAKSATAPKATVSSRPRFQLVESLKVHSTDDDSDDDQRPPPASARRATPPKSAADNRAPPAPTTTVAKALSSSQDKVAVDHPRDPPHPLAAHAPPTRLPFANPPGAAMTVEVDTQIQQQRKISTPRERAPTPDPNVKGSLPQPANPIVQPAQHDASATLSRRSPSKNVPEIPTPLPLSRRNSQVDIGPKEPGHLTSASETVAVPSPLPPAVLHLDESPSSAPVVTNAPLSTPMVATLSTPAVPAPTAESAETALPVAPAAIIVAPTALPVAPGAIPVVGDIANSQSESPLRPPRAPPSSSMSPPTIVLTEAALLAASGGTDSASPGRAPTSTHSSAHPIGAAPSPLAVPARPRGESVASMKLPPNVPRVANVDSILARLSTGAASSADGTPTRSMTPHGVLPAPPAAVSAKPPSAGGEIAVPRTRANSRGPSPAMSVTSVLSVPSRPQQPQAHNLQPPPPASAAAVVSFGERDPSIAAMPEAKPLPTPRVLDLLEKDAARRPSPPMQRSNSPTVPPIAPAAILTPSSVPLKVPSQRVPSPVGAPPKPATIKKLLPGANVLAKAPAVPATRKASPPPPATDKHAAGSSLAGPSGLIVSPGKAAERSQKDSAAPSKKAGHGEAETTSKRRTRPTASTGTGRSATQRNKPLPIQVFPLELISQEAVTTQAELRQKELAVVSAALFGPCVCDEVNADAASPSRAAVLDLGVDHVRALFNAAGNTEMQRKLFYTLEPVELASRSRSTRAADTRSRSANREPKNRPPSPRDGLLGAAHSFRLNVPRSPSPQAVPVTKKKAFGAWCFVDNATTYSSSLSNPRPARYVQICGGCSDACRETGLHQELADDAHAACSVELLIFPSEPKPPLTLVPPCDSVPLTPSAMLPISSASPTRTRSLSCATTSTTCRLGLSKYSVVLEVVASSRNRQADAAKLQMGSESGAEERNGESSEDDGSGADDRSGARPLHWSKRRVNVDVIRTVHLTFQSADHFFAAYDTLLHICNSGTQRTAGPCPLDFPHMTCPPSLWSACVEKADLFIRRQQEAATVAAGTDRSVGQPSYDKLTDFEFEESPAAPPTEHKKGVVCYDAFGTLRRARHVPTGRTFEIRVIRARRTKLSYPLATPSATTVDAETEHESDAACLIEYVTRLPFVQRVYAVLKDDKHYYIVLAPTVSRLSTSAGISSTSAGTLSTLRDYTTYLHANNPSATTQKSHLSLLAAQLIMALGGLHANGLSMCGLTPRRITIERRTSNAPEVAGEGGSRSLETIAASISSVGVTSQAWGWLKQQPGVANYLSPRFVAQHVLAACGHQGQVPLLSPGDDWFALGLILFEVATNGSPLISLESTSSPASSESSSIVDFWADVFSAFHATSQTELDQGSGNGHGDTDDGEASELRRAELRQFLYNDAPNFQLHWYDFVCSRMDAERDLKLSEPEHTVQPETTSEARPVRLQRLHSSTINLKKGSVQEGTPRCLLDDPEVVQLLHALLDLSLLTSCGPAPPQSKPHGSPSYCRSAHHQTAEWLLRLPIFAGLPMVHVFERKVAVPCLASEESAPTSKAPGSTTKQQHRKQSEVKGEVLTRSATPKQRTSTTSQAASPRLRDPPADPRAAADRLATHYSAQEIALLERIALKVSTHRIGHQDDGTAASVAKKVALKKVDSLVSEISATLRTSLQRKNHSGNDEQAKVPPPSASLVKPTTSFKLYRRATEEGTQQQQSIVLSRIQSAAPSTFVTPVKSQGNTNTNNNNSGMLNRSYLTSDGVTGPPPPHAVVARTKPESWFDEQARRKPGTIFEPKPVRHHGNVAEYTIEQHQHAPKETAHKFVEKAKSRYLSAGYNPRAEGEYEKKQRLEREQHREVFGDPPVLQKHWVTEFLSKATLDRHNKLRLQEAESAAAAVPTVLPPGGDTGPRLEPEPLAPEPRTSSAGQDARSASIPNDVIPPPAGLGAPSIGSRKNTSEVKPHRSQIRVVRGPSDEDLSRKFATLEEEKMSLSPPPGVDTVQSRGASRTVQQQQDYHHTDRATRPTTPPSRADSRSFATTDAVVSPATPIVPIAGASATRRSPAISDIPHESSPTGSPKFGLGAPVPLAPQQARKAASPPRGGVPLMAPKPVASVRASGLSNAVEEIPAPGRAFVPSPSPASRSADAIPPSGALEGNWVELPSSDEDE